MNSTFANLPGHQKLESARRGVLEMHQDDAGARGIADGDTVEVFNDRGTLRLRAHVNGGIAAGVVAAQLGWNKLSADGHNVNLLTSQRLNDLGGGPVFYSVLVEVRKAADAPHENHRPSV
jgi:anaerobic selenocysteine-containing dehydrogenase